VSGSARGPLVLGFAALGDGDASASREIVRPGIADAQLVALARESREEALSVMYGAYKTRIYTFLLRICGDPETSDDLTQDVFTKAYQALGTLTRDHRVLPWLYRIAHNTAIDHIRRRRRFQWLRVGKLAGTSEEPQSPDRHGAVPEQDQVRSVLASLPPEQATALLLHALEGYSYREIAEIQGSTLPAVRSRIARARLAFKAGYATKESSQPS
jgi:RNA polymerase sigma-70 factor (ECF subfamily)